MPRSATTILSVILIVASITACGPVSGADLIDYEKLNSLELVTAAIAAQKEGKSEEAGFLFLAAQARYQIDKQAYPPKGKGGNSPGVLMSALNASGGQALLGPVFRDGKAMTNIVKEFTNWNPRVDSDYNPGWEYENSLDEQARQAIVTSVRTKALNPLQLQANLLSNDEYQQLSKQMQAIEEIRKRYGAAAQANVGIEIPDKKLLAEYKDSQEKERSVRIRMNAIEWEINPSSRWHNQVGWKASDYFDDPTIVKLCEAIEANDVAEMERLIASGADVKTIGKEGMTPLMWAFPDYQPERFKCLLKHGANPNVFFESDFNTKNRPLQTLVRGYSSHLNRGCHAGQTVTHLSCRSPHVDFMKLVFEHNGDANLVDKKTQETPLDLTVNRPQSDAAERAKILIAKGADVNRFCEYTMNYPAIAAAHAYKFDIVLQLLKAGADPNAVRITRGPKSSRHSTLLHTLAEQQFQRPYVAQREIDFQTLLNWLGEHGFTLKRAEEDFKQDGTWQNLVQQKAQQEEWHRQASEEAKLRADRTGTLPPSALNPPAKITASQLVKTLNDEQLAAIKPSDDPKGPVFIMSFPSTLPRKEPWMSVFADGRLVCYSRLQSESAPINTEISQDEVTWLLHLAVNECKFLERKTEDVPEIQNGSFEGHYDFTISVKSGSNKFQLPTYALVVKKKRRDLGLEGFKSLTTFATEIVNRAVFKKFDAKGNILQKVNDELLAKYPGRPSFRLDHLTIADQIEPGKFLCGFEHEVPLGENKFEKLNATFINENGGPKVIVNAREYERR